MFSQITSVSGLTVGVCGEGVRGVKISLLRRDINKKTDIADAVVADAGVCCC